MDFLKSAVIALLVLAGSMPVAAGDSQAQSAVDPSEVEWTAERYLRAQPMGPVPVRPLSRDLPTERLATSLEEGPVGAPGRRPTRGSLPQFDLYIHDPGASPRFSTSGRGRQLGRQAAVVPGGGGRSENRGTSALDFSSSRLVPEDARVVYPYRTVGKLYFDKPGGGSFVCSGSVIQRRLVLTAGHCVHTQGKGFHKNFSFVPAYYRGNAPFGTWRVAKIWTTGEWSNGHGVPNAADFGILVMRDNFDGDSIGQVTGWLGWRTKSLTPNHLHILGYPGNLDKGKEMHQVTSGEYDCCFTKTATYGSDMGGGSSGGPWVQNFGVRANRQNVGKNTQTNRVVGVGSYGPLNKKVLYSGSSIPGEAFSNLFRKACNDSAANCT